MTNRIPLGQALRKIELTMNIHMKSGAAVDPAAPLF